MRLKRIKKRTSLRKRRVEHRGDDAVGTMLTMRLTRARMKLSSQMRKKRNLKRSRMMMKQAAAGDHVGDVDGIMELMKAIIVRRKVLRTKKRRL